MILRRLSQSIRKQDWFTVVIEILIVTVGIAAGLQANEWAQERQERKLEEAALERLFLEAKDSQKILASMVERTAQLNQMRRDAVQFADSDMPVPDNEMPLKIGINTLAMFPPLVPVSVAYDELKSSGQLQLIRSAQQRAQVAGFHAELDFQNRQRASFRDRTSRFFELYQVHVIWDYNPESTTTDILLSTFNWETMRADERIIFQLIGLLRNQLVAEQGLMYLHAQAKSMCETLGEIVNANGRSNAHEQEWCD